MKDLPDLAGQVFGFWTILSGPYGQKWEVVCDCGYHAFVAHVSLVSGKSTACKSCASTKHGLSKLRSYAVWANMMQRCHNPKSTSWEDYGGRGISVDPHWHDVANFVADMGERPGRMQIDRKDNDGNYTRDNCHWVMPIVNGRNKRTTVWVEYRGRSMSMAEAAELSGIPYATLEGRRNRDKPLFPETTSAKEFP